LAVVVVLFVGPARAAPTTLDLSFGAGGKVTTSFGSDDDGAAAALLQRDGKIVAAGIGDGAFALARYNANGSLDASFGSGGKVTTPIRSRSGASAIVLQPDGKIVAAGRTFSGNDSRFALARYDADGLLDSTFGSGGTVTTAFGPGYVSAHALALEPNGKIVAAGIGSSDFALARYNPDGSLDAEFGDGGKVRTAFDSEGSDDRIEALVLQPDGRIVAVGWTDSGENYDFALARYEVDGRPDPTFGRGGKMTTAIGPNHDFAFALARLPDGKLLAAGWSEQTSGESLTLVRYAADGSLDKRFGNGGISVSGANALAYALALRPDGKIVAAGNTFKGGENYDFVLARYRANGSLDPRFGNRGMVTTAFGADWDAAYALLLQPDGKMVAAGEGGGDFALARYLGGNSSCTVPNVKGKKLAEARRSIRRAHCTVGSVEERFSRTVGKGHVIAQKPRPGLKRPDGAKVNLLVSRGRSKRG